VFCGRSAVGAALRIWECKYRGFWIKQFKISGCYNNLWLQFDSLQVNKTYHGHRQTNSGIFLSQKEGPECPAHGVYEIYAWGQPAFIFYVFAGDNCDYHPIGFFQTSLGGLRRFATAGLRRQGWVCAYVRVAAQACLWPGACSRMKRRMLSAALAEAWPPWLRSSLRLR